MSLIWREQMSVANTLIDTEHKYLLEQVNQIEEAINTKENHDIIVEALDNLVKYTKTHFEHEELIQYKINYPRHGEHKVEHKKIMQNLYAIKEKLDIVLDGDNPESSMNHESHVEIDGSELEDNHEVHSVTKDDLEPLVGLIRSWVIEHVIGSDMDMKPYLIKRPMDLE